MTTEYQHRRQMNYPQLQVNSAFFAGEGQPVWNIAQGDGELDERMK